MIFEELKGKVIKNISVSNCKTEVYFIDSTGQKYKMYHEQDCCEDVYLDEIHGDLADIVGTPIIEAKTSSNWGDNDYGTFTWTFYTITTKNGTVTLRWNGESNGYYSEEVSFKKIGESWGINSINES